MKTSVMMSIVIPVTIEAESVEEAERIHARFAEWLSQRPRILMAKRKWKIRKRV